MTTPITDDKLPQRPAGLFERVAIALMTITIALASTVALYLNWGATKATNRAYVVLRDLSFAPTSAEKIQSWAVIPKWENGGNTATNLMFMRANYAIGGPALDEGFSQCDWNADIPSVPMVLGPKQTSQISVGAIPIDPLVMFQKTETGVSQFKIWGWARYRDQFSDEQHTTRFCYNVERLIGDLNVSTTIPQLIFSLCAEGNCTDKQCAAERRILNRGIGHRKTFCERIRPGVPVEDDGPQNWLAN